MAAGNLLIENYDPYFMINGLRTNKDVVFGGTFSQTGDFAVNTDKFTVAGTSGNTAIAGTLAVTGALSLGTAEATAVKGIYKATVSVTVPSITDPDEAHVDVDVSAAFTMQPAIGDLVFAAPLVALPTNCNILGSQVSATDQVTITYGSEGGNVTGAAKNHSIIIIDLT